MKKYMDYMDVFKKCKLLEDIEEKDLASMLTCLGAVQKSYEKNDFILSAGQRMNLIGILVTGGAHVVKEDFWGDRTILADIKPGEIFGESFSFAGAERLSISVVATQRSEIVFVDYKRIITTCPNSCEFHSRLIKNMVIILAKNNIALTKKIEVLTRRTTRDKILSYLSMEALEQGDRSFSIPFNRQQLADFLGVDRSAMSRELSNMQKDGLFTYDKNRFCLSKAIDIRSGIHS